MKPGGSFLSQALTSKPNVTGTLRLIPTTLALRAVQRQTAASRSANPSSKGQHLPEEGPTARLTSPPRRSTQAPSFNVSLGHLAPPAGFTGGAFLGIWGIFWCRWCRFSFAWDGIRGRKCSEKNEGED